MHIPPILKTLLRARKVILAFGLPIILLAIPLEINTQEARCAYVVLLMALFWLLELVPLAVTALLPVFMFPLMGVLSTDEVCKQYMRETLMIFLGSLMAATAVEHCNLHQRMALRVLLLVGPKPRWLLLGFMLTTSILSMWISNSATAALMVPILDAVLQQLTSPRRSIAAGSISNEENIEMTDVIRNRETDDSMRKISIPRVSISDVRRPSSAMTIEKDPQSKALRHALYLGVCYAANVGGTGTLTGTTPNLVLKENLEAHYPDYDGLHFASWMIFNFPGAIINTLLAWVFLQVVYLRKCKTDSSKDELVTSIIRKKYDALGSMTFHELSVLFLFVLMVILFFFRQPEFIPGWAGFRPSNYMKDAATAVFICVLMFIIPADPKRLGESPPLLEWSVAQEKISWGLVLVLGGGFALAEAANKSGLSTWIALQLSSMHIDNVLALQLIVSIIALFLTEVTSNTATATILLPVIAKMADMKGFHPLLLMMPACVSCSYAFLLPIASGPNAITYEAAKFKTMDMFLPGIAMKIICLTVILVAIHTLGEPIFDLSHPLVSNSTAAITPNETTSIPDFTVANFTVS